MITDHHHDNAWSAAADSCSAGFTIFEAVVVMAIFTLIMAGALTVLTTYQDVMYVEQDTGKDQDAARKCLETIKGDVQESNLNYVFTDFWTGSGSPRTSIYNFGYRQCVNATCPWLYNRGLPTGYIYPNRYLWNFKWTSGDTLCPIDGSASILTNNIDSMILYSGRDNPDLSRGFLHLDEQGAVRWRAIVFYFPFCDAVAQQAQLRRARLYLSDIDASVSKDFGDLLTFSEGTTHQHAYYIGGYEAARDVYWFYLYLHRLSSDGTKETRFEVRQATFWPSNCYIYVRHPNVNNGSPWSRSFSRTQEVIGTNVVDIDFSTAASNSISGSFIDPGAVRVTLATQSMPYSRGVRARQSSAARPLTTVLCTMLHPRN
jgi:type II secretory pathway pseudopilin PulG